tara:strand:+ start:1420 stop:1656 length:237 start_codon:yes stop_codon:yes gene_type:complete
MRKGQTGTQVNGWKFEIMDNMKGNIRLAKVYGFETEIGSIYIHDIASVDMPDGNTEPIEFTPAQAKKAAQILMRSLWT